MSGTRTTTSTGGTWHGADLLWGSLPVAKKANTDSFSFTNITPQMDEFIPSARAGVWGHREDVLFADVDVEDLKINLFAGPGFQDDDRAVTTSRSSSAPNAGKQICGPGRWSPSRTTSGSGSPSRSRDPRPTWHVPSAHRLHCAPPARTPAVGGSTR
jgi:hypothetical protein